MSKLCITAVLAVLILGCVAPTVKPGQPTCRSFDIDYSTVILPDHFGDIGVAERTVFEKQNAGLLVRYAKPGARTSWIDVFVYPICLPKFCSLAHIGELEMAKVVKEVQTAHSGAEVQDLGSFVGERNGKRYEALKARIKIPKDGRWLSFAYLAPIDDVYVKIRFTQPEGEDHESVVDGVVASLLSEFRFKNPKAHKHEIAPTLLVHSRETETGKSHVLSALLSYGAFMSIEVEKGRYIDSLDRSLNCWEPTLKILEGITSKQPAGAVDTSFAGMIAARNAGYLREYVWTYFRRPYWTQPGDLKLEEFKVWSSRNLKDHLPADVSRVLVEWK